MTTTNNPAGKANYRFRYYKGVRFVAPGNAAPSSFARCGTCGRAWDDDKPTGMTPTPSGRCPFEGFRGHNTEPEVERAMCSATHGKYDVPCTVEAEPDCDGLCWGHYKRKQAARLRRLTR